MKIATVGILAFVLVAGLWMVTYADSEGTITACVNYAGLFRLKGKGSCRKNETELSWNIQGEQGEKGDRGEQGEAGINGIDGKNGTTLHLFDGNGQDLGVVVGTTGVGFVTFVPEIEALMEFSQNGSTAKWKYEESTGIGIYYSEPDCLGVAYVSNFQPMEVRKAQRGGYVTSLASTTATRFIKSISTQSETCSNNAFLVENSAEARFVTLPFSLPITFPLHVREIE